MAAILGANRLGPTLFELLGAACGLYLVYLGARAVMTKKDAPPQAIGARRPLATGLAFGLTNPKSYPVALAMFSAIVAPYVSEIRFSDAPQLLLAAMAGFLAADATLIFAAGLPAVRRFFLTHGVAVTRIVGVLFIAFGAKSLFDAANGAMRRTALTAAPLSGATQSFQSSAVQIGVARPLRGRPRSRNPGDRQAMVLSCKFTRVRGLNCRYLATSPGEDAANSASFR